MGMAVPLLPDPVGIRLPLPGDNMCDRLIGARLLLQASSSLVAERGEVAPLSDVLDRALQYGALLDIDSECLLDLLDTSFLDIVVDLQADFLKQKRI